MDRLRKVRKFRGVTLKELGKAIGVRDSTISQYETGKNNPNLERLVLIANYLGVTTDYLLGRTDMLLNDNALEHYIDNLEDSGNHLARVAEWFDPYYYDDWLEEAKDMDEDQLKDNLLAYVDDAKNAIQGALSFMVDLKTSVTRKAN